MPKISVIVPVYKTEPYLERCIDSILNQTYKDLELILVDDGSPDNCPALCDQAAQRDSRVRVIHKENGGVSSARNIGLTVASGSYIGFVDSDDWVKPDMYARLVSELEKGQADIACCNYQYGEYENEDSKQVFLYNGMDACEKMFFADRFGAGVSTAPVDKLYRADLIKAFCYKEGCGFGEDVLMTTTLFCNAQTIIKIDDTFYYYCLTENSAVRSNYNPNKLTEIPAFYDCLKLFEEKGFGKLRNFMVSFLFSKLLYHWCQCYKRKKNAFYSRKLSDLRVYVMEHFRTYRFLFDRKEILKFYVFRYIPRLFYFVTERMQKK